MAIRTIAPVQDQLGEGALWDSARQLLWWVDIKRALLHRHDPATGDTRTIALSLRTTALALTPCPLLLAATDAGFVWLDPADGSSQPWVHPTGEPSGNRFNDGKVDPAGRFWAGTMDDAEQDVCGALHCVDAVGTVTRVADGFMVPNGPAFDAEGRMYLADSARQVIYRYPSDAPGDPDQREVFITFAEGQGYPDGMTCDAEGHLWVAFWDGWCIRRISPQGLVVEEIAIPVQRPTCCAFGGDRLSTLFITSARTGLDEEALSLQPDAGALFAIDLPLTGMPAAIFGGSSPSSILNEA